jgi:hypothetical protein
VSTPTAASGDQPTSHPTGRPVPWLGAVFVVLWVVGFGGGAVFLVHAQLTGTPATVTVDRCEDRTTTNYVCTGTWTVDGVTTSGVIDGDAGDPGDTADVRIRDGRAYPTSLRLPIILGVIALSLPVLALWSLVQSRRARASAREPLPPVAG